MAKGPQAFRTISEAADELGVPQHVLRFWETKFSFIRPMKRAGGRRFYRPQDIAVLDGVRSLLHRDGMTIKAVQALYKDEGVRRIVAAAEALPEPLALPAVAPEPLAEREPPPSAAEPDLFDDLPPSPAPAPAPVMADAPRPRLNPIGRVRLSQTLIGLEEIKARLDHLIEQGGKDR